MSTAEFLFVFVGGCAVGALVVGGWLGHVYLEATKLEKIAKRVVDCATTHEQTMLEFGALSALTLRKDKPEAGLHEVLDFVHVSWSDFCAKHGIERMVQQ